MQNIKTILTVVAVAVVGFLGYWFTKTPTPEVVTENTDTVPASENTQTNLEVNTPVVNAEVNTTSTKYKDGTYTVNTNYFAPPGKENLGVTVTILNDKITAVSTNNLATNRESISYQNKFASGVNAAVTGKNIDNLKLSVVSGASLTTGGFNTALNQIRTQALR